MESLVLGDDMLGQVLRCVKGIDVSDESISLDAMKAVCLGGPGHYLGHDQTLSLMQTEYIYPVVADRTTPKLWVEMGSPDLIQQAILRKNRILAEGSWPKIAPDLDAAVRAKYRIHF